MSNAPAIEAIDLTKSFGKKHALQGINLNVEPGQVYGLLGPNGAGKTTTVGILATLLRPTSGTARVLGFDVASQPREIRSRISLTGQYASVDEDLTGKENLVLIARLCGFGWKQSRARADELLSAFDLEDSATHLVRTYSGGMRRRLDVAAGLIVTPQLVFLDEPTTGLDPRSRNQVWDIVRLIAGSGSTVLLTTQYMDEADRLAHRLAVIDRGKVIAEGTAAELKSGVGANTLKVRFYSVEERNRAEQALSGGMSLTIHPGHDAFSFMAGIEQEAQIAKSFHLLSENGIRIAEFTVGQPSMDEVFFALTGHAAVASEEQDKDTESSNG
ncbi:MAG: ATP-binding cassette domain-containing protein [Leptospiraceae bacterium]|nr:ATP-binding cassette domain-containing protein [Leptospiraceae bacterium]MCB1303454.1 ATP-binding cassette domain-containing protein [Leptospiraceae bacterium]